MFVGCIGHAKSIPCGHAVEAQNALRDFLLQESKGLFQPLQKDNASDIAQLRFGIVQVEEIDRLESQITAGSFNLIIEKFGGNAMHASRQLLRIENSRLNVLAHEISARIRRHLAIERQVASLGRNKDLIALQFLGTDYSLQGSGDVAFRTLVAV